MIKKVLFLFILINFQLGFSQTRADDFNFVSNYFYNLKKLNFEKIKNDLKNISTNKTKLYSYYLLIIIEDDGQTKLSNLNPKLLNLSLKNTLTAYEKYLLNLILGYINLNYKKDKVTSFIHFTNSLDIAENLKYNKILKKNALLSILKFYQKVILQSDIKLYKNYLKSYKNLCKDDIDNLYYYSANFNLLCQSEIYNEYTSKINPSLIKVFKGYDSLAQNSTQLGKTKLYYYKDKANLIIRQKPNKAETLLKKAEQYFTKSKFYNSLKYINLTNTSRIYSLKKNNLKGLYYLEKAKKYININDSLLYLYDLHSQKANHFYHLKQYDSAYYYEKKVRLLGYKVNFQRENEKVTELKTKLDTQKKEKENLQLKQVNLEKESQIKQNKNFLIGSFLFILLGITIASLTLKNSKRKRKLAEKQKELEQQKNLTLLKEQEITTINAMVEGQEKERKRVAEDLHDNLGSVLATLKLHFENLKINQEKKKINQEKLFDKTGNLIDEAYLKVRKIAHAENAGVIAHQGLLKAIQIMAEKISSADKINIDVIHFGLRKRLENGLEITIFRIVQELITNILKHAEAKNATINISLYGENVNIIIEDDGKGFNIKKVNLKNGMGLNSIKTRIEHLQGTFNVDSTIGKGTSILLNIPIT